MSDFYAIDRAQWHKVCELGLNPAVAYLVLACYSDKSNKFTSASAHAVETYTSIARSRAKAAVEANINAGTIALAESKTSKPRYDLVPGVPAQGADWIWLPKALVTGVAAEVPPLERVRQVQDVMLLRLLVDLYGASAPTADWGIPRDIVCQDYGRKARLGSRAQYVVWGFERHGLTYVGKDPLIRIHDGAFLERVETLQTLGLLDFVPHVAESADGEIIHTYEGEVGDAAHDAGVALLAEGQQTRAEYLELRLLPMLKHQQAMTILGIARLRYSPKTKLAVAQHHHLEATSDYWIRFYGIIESRCRDGKSLMDLIPFPPARAANDS